MPRRKHLPLPILLALSVVCAILAGTLIQVRRPDIGQQAVQAQIEARTPRERCDRLGDEWTFVTRTNPDVSLCYKTAWGWPDWDVTMIHPDYHAGKAYGVTFLPHGGPYISFESPDFTLTGPMDVPPVDWPFLDPALSETDLQRRLGAERVRVFLVGDIPVIQAFVSGLDLSFEPFSEVRFYVLRPEFHIRMTVDPESAADIETMLRASL